MVEVKNTKVGRPPKKQQPPKSESSTQESTDIPRPHVVELDLDPVQRQHLVENIKDALQMVLIDGKSVWDNMGSEQKSIAIQAINFHYRFPNRVTAIENNGQLTFRFKFIVPGTEHEVEIERTMGKSRLDHVV